MSDDGTESGKGKWVGKDNQVTNERPVEKNEVKQGERKDILPTKPWDKRTDIIEAYHDAIKHPRDSIEFKKAVEHWRKLSGEHIKDELKKREEDK